MEEVEKDLHFLGHTFPHLVSPIEAAQLGEEQQWSGSLKIIFVEDFDEFSINPKVGFGSLILSVYIYSFIPVWYGKPGKGGVVQLFRILF